MILGLPRSWWFGDVSSEEAITMRVSASAYARYGSLPDIGLSFQELESVDMSLHGSLTSFERESRFDHIVVFQQSLRKVFQFRNVLLFNLFEPSI